MHAYSACDIGLVRDENQDHLITQPLEDGVLALVCDGMGGMLYGAEASQIAIEAFAEHFRSAYQTGISPKDICTLLRDAAAAANRTLYHSAAEHAVRQRMGTTLVGAFVRGDTACLVNVGDSRAYLIGEKGEAQQLTLDHTVVQLLYERGDIKAEERAAHPRRNELTRAVGVSPRMLADSYEMQLHPGEVLLLCSDGLYNLVTAKHIADLIRSHAPAEAPAALVAAANENGGKDNISVILLTADDAVESHGSSAQ